MRVSEFRCWDCHLANLRATGNEARADRLEAVRRLQDEGQLDWGRLTEGLMVAYEKDQQLAASSAPPERPDY